MHLDYVGYCSSAGSEFVGPGQAHRFCISNELGGDGRGGIADVLVRGLCKARVH